MKHTARRVISRIIPSLWLPRKQPLLLYFSFQINTSKWLYVNYTQEIWGENMSKCMLGPPRLFFVFKY